VEQVKRLCGEVGAFENRDAYVFSAEVESRSADHIAYRCFAVEREPPSDEWALLAGEAIQNVRSALDHLVWAAVKEPTTRTQFPIFTDADKFRVRGARDASRRA
jgi:hypothetical protein